MVVLWKVSHWLRLINIILPQILTNCMYVDGREIGEVESDPIFGLSNTPSKKEAR